MTFDAFITKYTGVGVDTDNYPSDNKYQCMDLMHKYVEEVLGFTEKSLLGAPTASQAYTNFTATKYFQKIDNSLFNVPQKGDIMFYGTKIGPSGHVCIVYSANVLNFKSFDQNWPAGSLPHIQDHNYVGVLGWLRAIPQVSDDRYKLALQKIKTIIDAELG
jgi:hypothetical protein